MSKIGTLNFEGLKSIGSITCPKTKEMAYLCKCVKCVDKDTCEPLNQLSEENRKRFEIDNKCKNFHSN